MANYYKRAVIITDNEIFYLGMKDILESRTIIHYAERINDVKDIYELSDTYQPQLVIFDWDSYDQSIKIIRRMTEEKNNVLVFSQDDYPFIGSLCSKYNASGYMSKSSDASKIAEVINHCILMGGKYFHSTLKKPPSLSKNEYIVAKFLCDGEANNSIAQKLSISEKTVSTYKMRIYNKLGIKSVVSLCDYIKYTKS